MTWHDMTWHDQQRCIKFPMKRLLKSPNGNSNEKDNKKANEKSNEKSKWKVEWKGKIKVQMKSQDDIDPFCGSAGCLKVFTQVKVCVCVSRNLFVMKTINCVCQQDDNDHHDHDHDHHHHHPHRGRGGSLVVHTVPAINYVCGGSVTHWVTGQHRFLLILVHCF